MQARFPQNNSTKPHQIATKVAIKRIRSLTHNLLKNQTVKSYGFYMDNALLNYSKTSLYSLKIINLASIKETKLCVEL
jgi:hypothetical protein